MAAVITSISPVRGRVGDVITITGTGFSAANNSVDVITPAGGTTNAQTLTSQSTTELVFTLAEPSGPLTVNFQNRVRATNDDDASNDSVHWLLKDTKANLCANALGAQQPGPFEVTATETATRAESKDLERAIARDERHDEVGGAAFPNLTSGAEAVGTDATPFTAATPARNTVQAALEMLDTQVVLRVTKALFDSNTILKADSDNTPAALAVAEQRLVGRITSGVIAALTAAQVRTLLNVENAAAADQTLQEVTDTGATTSNVVTFTAPPTSPDGTLAEAWGASASAAGTDALAVGESAVASGADSTALGSGSTASGGQSTAVGEGASCTANNSVALGRLAVADTTTTEDQLTAIGATAVASGDGSTAVGYSAAAAGQASTAVGRVASASAVNSVAIGSSAIADTTTTEDQLTAVGAFAVASGDASTAIGYTATAAGSSGTALGRIATASGSTGTALGSNTTASGVNSTAVGGSSSASGDNSVALGTSATANTTTTEDQMTALGASAIASGDASTAVGFSADATATNSTAVGTNAQATTGADTAAFGNAATATGANSLALGTSADATGSASTAVGNDAQATNSSALALGRSASASGTDSTALGANTAVAHASSIAIGRLATTTAANQLVIGSSGRGIEEVYIGEGVTQSTPTALTIQGTGGSGTDIAGSAVTIAGGKGTGAGAPGDLIFSTSTTLATGTTLQTLATRCTINETNALFTVPVGVPSKTVATLPADVTAGQIIFVSDETGGATLAFSDGTNWRRQTDLTIVA